MTSTRGAVLVESAFAVSLILLFTYAAVQLGMVGLEQLTVDGGAFTAAHQQALLGANLKNYKDAAALAKATLPHLVSPDVSVPEPSFGAPPATSDTSTYATQYNVANSNARHGGISMIEPVQTVSIVQSSNLPDLLLGAATTLSVTGIAIDPAFRLINGHGDLSGNGFNSPGAFSTASDPLVDGNNAPPYFIGFNYMFQCLYANSQNATPGWNSCPSPSIVALGLAEYLDVNNWGLPLNGVVPDKEAVFYQTRRHQDKYASIANALSQPGANKATILDPRAGDVACVYSYDNETLGTYVVGARKIGDFPLNPAGNPVFCGP